MIRTNIHIRNIQKSKNSLHSTAGAKAGGAEGGEEGGGASEVRRSRSRGRRSRRRSRRRRRRCRRRCRWGEEKQEQGVEEQADLWFEQMWEYFTLICSHWTPPTLPTLFLIASIVIVWSHCFSPYCTIHATICVGRELHGCAVLYIVHYATIENCTDVLVCRNRC